MCKFKVFFGEIPLYVADLYQLFIFYGIFFAVIGFGLFMLDRWKHKW